MQQKFDDSVPLNTAIFRSWSSMKTPVMVWLWSLNVVYWIAFYYLPRPEAVWALVSYLAVGPMIFFMTRAQRGLTRLTGLIHLPWVPYAGYLAFRLFGDPAGPAWADDPVYYAWLQIMLWSTLVCLVLDIYDVARWFSGQRFVLGTPAAHAAGASKLASMGP